MQPRLRPAARALVLDPANRVLLVQFRFAHGDVWATPGGGVDHGEAHTEALRRELHEEVGYTDARIGPAIWTRTHLFPLSETYDGQTETIYLVRVHSPELPPALLSDEQLRNEFLVGRAWWTIPELFSSEATFAPRRLPALVANLIEAGPPDTPIDVGI